jgi:hypothetical protein
MLIFIYYYKGILSISDIQKLFNPITEKYFKTDGDFDLKDIYDEVFTMGYEQIDTLKKQVKEEYEKAMDTFHGAPDEDRDFLRIFSFICLLSFDVYVKKNMIEQIIDGLDRQMDSEN